MTRLWIDIEDAQGVRQGDGPILSALTWEHTRRLAQVGTFRFQMPAGDARADLVRLGRVARAWTVQGGALVEKGAGTIESVQAQAGADALLLEVNGDDILRELVNRRVGDLALFDTVVVHPCATWLQGASPTYLHTAVDLQVGDTATYATIQPNSETNHWLISDALPFRGVRIVLATQKNTVTDALHVQYYDATEAQWTDLTVTDGTLASGASLGQSGDITWESPADWGPQATRCLYDVRLWIGSCGAVDVADVALIRDEPTPDALERVLALVAERWSLDTVLGYADISRATELGSDLVLYGDFEGPGTGTADDGTSDTWDGWTNVGVNDGLGNKIEASQVGHSVRFACRIIHSTSTAESSPEIYQDITGLDEAADYLLTCWTLSDGTAQGRLRVEDRSHTPAGDPQYITPRVYTGWTGTAWSQIEVEFTTPVGCTAVRIHLYGADEALALGSVYWDDVVLKQRLGGKVFLQMANESVFETLTRIAEQTGENFILSPTGRRVTWLRKDQRNADLTCVPAGASAPPAGSDVAFIADLLEEQSGYELASRVYATGAGSGAARLTMAEATRPVPSGYTFDRTNNCLIRDAAETALGRIDGVLDCPEVAAQGVGPDQLRFAANALFDRAYEWLQRHSATDTHRITGDVPRAYALTLAGCNRLLLPGYLVRLVYRKVLQGYVALDVNALLWILSATEQVGQDGAATVALEVATVASRPATSDGARLAQLWQQMRAMRAHG